MNKRSCSSILVAMLLALAFPVSGTAAQEHHHYKLIDLGTLGGPSAYKSVSAPGYQIINNAGVIAFGADTPLTDPNTPLLCFAAFADAPELNATQNPNALYRLFNTQNTHNLLLLNTMDGSIRTVQWGDTFSRPLPKCPVAALSTGRPDGVAAASVEVAERMTGGAGG